MTTLALPPFPTVTAAEVAVRSGWAVVDGVMPESVSFSHDGSADGMWINYVPAPPPEWVRAAGVCEACGGVGIAGSNGYPDGYGELIWRTRKCLACHGVGKPRVEVTAACPSEPWHDGWHNCALCSSTSSIHVAWVTVTEVLPVVDAEKDNGASTVIAVYDDGSVELWEPDKGDEGRSIDITADVAHLGPPAGLVEKYLLKLEEVT